MIAKMLFSLKSLCRRKSPAFREPPCIVAPYISPLNITPPRANSSNSSPETVKPPFGANLTYINPGVGRLPSRGWYPFSVVYFSRGTLPKKGKMALLGDLDRDPCVGNQLRASLSIGMARCRRKLPGICVWRRAWAGASRVGTFWWASAASVTWLDALQTDWWTQIPYIITGICVYQLVLKGIPP